MPIMMKYVREAGLRNINQSHTAQQELYQTVLTLQSLSHTCMTFFLHLNFQKSLRTEVNMWTCPTQGSGGLRWAQVSTGEQTEGLKDMRWRSRPAPVWTQGTGAGSPRQAPTWRTNRRWCRSTDDRPPTGSSPRNNTSPGAPEEGAHRQG